MPENTVTASFAPMEPEDIVSAFAYIRALQADDVDTACAVIEETGMRMRRLLLDVAARVIIPVTALDDRDRELCAHSFMAAALGRLLLEVLCVDDDVCPGMSPGIAQAIIRFTEDILATERGDVAGVLREVEAAWVEQAMEAHSAPAGAHPGHPTIA